MSFLAFSPTVRFEFEGDAQLTDETRALMAALDAGLPAGFRAIVVCSPKLRARGVHGVALLHGAKYDMHVVDDTTTACPSTIAQLIAASKADLEACA